MKQKIIAMLLTLLMIVSGGMQCFAATETVVMLEEVLNEDFEQSNSDSLVVPGYLEKVTKGGSTMLKHAATDNPGENTYANFSVTEKPNSNVFDISFDICAEGHPASGTQFFYVQLNPSGGAMLQIIIKSDTTNQLGITLGNTTPSWMTSTDDFYTDTPVNIRLSIDKTAETISGYINGAYRGSCSFSEVGGNIATIKTTAVNSIRIYRYRGHFDTKFFIDNLVVKNSVNVEYDPDEMEMNFSAQMDYSEAQPKLVLSNGVDSKYLAQDIKVSLVSEADSSVTNLGSVTLEKATDATASFSLSESLPTLSAGYYYVTLERYVNSVLKGATKQQKIYIATQAQLSQLPTDFSALPTDLTTATAKVEGYLPCFLTEEELNNLLPKDTQSGNYTQDATNNLEFITKYFQNTAKTYADVTAVQTEFSKAKGYLELKNAADTTQVRSVLVNGNYLTSYLTDDVFTANETEFFKQFDTKRNDNTNLLISDSQIADALRYAYAMTALNVAERSGISEIINTYNDVFGVNLTAAGVEKVSADDLYAVFYHKDYMDTTLIQSDWNQKLQELLAKEDEKNSVTQERPFPPSAGGGGGGGFGAAKQTVLTPSEPPKPEVKPDEIIPVALTDVTNHWAKDYVEVLSEKGIVTGFSDGTFRPDATLNRAELAVMLSRIISDYDEGSVVNFADVKSGDWFYEAVLKMSALGIVQGSDGSFMPYESVTREQLAVMIYRALAPEGYSSASVSFADSDDISAYAKEAISYLGGEKILSGFEDNTIRPKAETTRAQAAKLLSELLDKLSR